MGVEKKLHWEHDAMYMNIYYWMSVTDVQSYYIKPFFMTWCGFMDLMCKRRSSSGWDQQEGSQDGDVPVEMFTGRRAVQ